MDDLIAFLTARIDDDEMLAKAATPGPWTDAGSCRIVIVEQVAAGTGTPAASLHMIAEITICDEHKDRRTADAGHIARHDPARVLRDVEADRELIAAYKNTAEFSDPWIGLNLAIRIRAKRFRDHPGYRAEWAPVVARS